MTSRTSRRRAAGPEQLDESAADTPAVRFENIGIRFGGSTRDWVARHIDLDIRAGELFVVVGPSGCGKSTLLLMTAGIVEPTEGAVSTRAGRVSGPGPDRAMVFQSVDTPLMEWLTTRQNVEFGLRMKGVPKRKRAVITDEYLRKVGLTRAADKFPHELSGGMKQRVQIARVLAVSPEIVLMDEPFAALDAQTRRLMQREVERIWQEEKRTFLYVTHDIREAVLLGERIAVMSAPPVSGIKSLYEVDLPHPRNEFSPEFAELAHKIGMDIQEEVDRQWSDAEG